MLNFLFTTLLIAACTRTASQPLRAQPALDFPTQAITSIPVCNPSDLFTSANSNGATGEITLGVTLTNKSGNLCTLSNPPKAVLLDASDQIVEAETNQLQAILTPRAPALLALAPNDSVIVSLVWRNYCHVLPGSLLTIRLTLAENKAVDVAVKLPAEPRCENKTEPSTIMVAPYSNPP